jgi:hypothetical protein
MQDNLSDDRIVRLTESRGQFRFEVYRSAILHQEQVQWDYRDTKGTLFSGVALTVEDARRMAEQQSGEKIQGAQP